MIVQLHIPHFVLKPPPLITTGKSGLTYYIEINTSVSKGAFLDGHLDGAAWSLTKRAESISLPIPSITRESCGSRELRQTWVRRNEDLGPCLRRLVPASRSSSSTFLQLTRFGAQWLVSYIRTPMDTDTDRAIRHTYNIFVRIAGPFHSSLH